MSEILLKLWSKIPGILGFCMIWSSLLCCMSMYDDWYNPAPLPHSMLQDEGWQVILHYDIVSKNLQSEAIAMLEDQPIIEIGFDLFLYYGSEKVLEEEDSRYYLARSLHYYANIDGYDILFKDGSVSIFHGSLGVCRIDANQDQPISHFSPDQPISESNNFILVKDDHCNGV